MPKLQRELLEEFRAYLKKDFDKQCATAYLEKPGAMSITEQALARLKKACDEATKP